MFGYLIPKEVKFFDLFSEHADHIVSGAKELLALMQDFSKLEFHAHNIKTFEGKADSITHTTVQLLHKTFITPIDRDAIHQLITNMDDILDLMEDATQVIQLYDIRAVTDESRRLAELCVTSAEFVQSAVNMLSDMRNADAIMKICTEIDRIESEADYVMRAAMSKLFRDEPDVKQLIKMKALYELLEEVTDRCEDVANILEGIVLEHA